MSSRRGRGRPRLPRGVIDLGADAWTPPDAVVLDTSAVVEFLLPSQRAHEHWRLFFTACAEHGTSLIFNRLVETELYDALFNIALRERWGKGTAHGPKRYDGRTRARALRLLGAPRRSRALEADAHHAMSCGPLASTGGLYEADLTVDALRSAGVDMGP